MTVLDVARSYIGYKETPVNRTIFGERYGVNGAAWCMMFIQEIFKEADDALAYRTASCNALYDWYRKNDPETVSTAPSVGAIAMIKVNGKIGHTGIVESFTDTTVTCIEGNTSPDEKGSQDNGDGVYRRTRKRSVFKAFVDPHPYSDQPEGALKSMKAIKGSTANETACIEAVQGAIGAVRDGEIGCQTVSDIACRLGAIKKPLTLAIWSTPCIIAKNVKIVASPNKGLASYTNAINGGFYSRADGSPCSMCIADGKIVYGYSAHYWDGNGYPETVLYREKSGAFGIRRVKRAAELPACEWAVGGLGLLDFYDPIKEGFVKVDGKDFTDVLKKNNHTFIGIKNGYVYLGYAKQKTAAAVNELAKKLGFEKAIMLDGGSIAAINGTESFAKINTRVLQHYVIQGVE